MFEFDFDSLLDDLPEPDEKTMTDLHLGSAINLDQIEYLVTGKFDDYRIFIPRYLQQHWANLQNKIIEFEKKEIGFLQSTQLMLMTDSPDAVLHYNLYKWAVKLIGTALKKRNVNFPLASCYEKLASSTLVCRSIYMEFFRYILKLCCMVSECSRGGEKSFYTGMYIQDGIVFGSINYNQLHWQIAATNSICILSDVSRRVTCYGSFESLLLIMDTLGQRLCLQIGLQIADIGSVSGTVDSTVIQEIITIGDSVLVKYGNMGFEFIGMFEAMVVAALLKRNPDPITDSSEFLTSCRAEIEEMTRDGTFDEWALIIFDTLSQTLQTLDDNWLSNIFCIYRIWGHPRVNIKGGMSKVMKKGVLVKDDPSYVGNVVLLQFKKMFISEFYNRHHQYPPCTFTTEESNYIRECITSGLPISVDHSCYTILDYRDLVINQLWDIPETYDVCHILNDKSVSPTRSELYESLSRGLGTVMGVQRRGIIRWLLSDSIRCKEFLQQIDTEGLDDDSLIIGMYEKEREIKVQARMFSLMSEKMRMYFVLTEEMISQHLLKYFPQITMKDPLHVQIKKLWTVSGMSHEDCFDPIINIDFEKWNLNMRKEFTLPLFSQFDQLFGFNNLISRTHDIFYNSYIYSSSGKYLPKIQSGELVIEPPMTYTHHLGGFEGLRQKGWTLATVCLLCYIADKLRARINLLGQGDNQVVRIYMPHSYWENLNLSRQARITSARTILSDYLDKMSIYFSEAGLPIKVRETWKSTRLYMYGKCMYLDGRALPQWTKKLLRSYALTNEGTLTISGVIGTIATNLCAAAHASDKPDIMYVVYLLLAEWSLEYLFAYHPFTRMQITENSLIQFKMASKVGQSTYSSGRLNLKLLKLVIMLIPTAVGGSVTIPLTGFIIRGFPDNACEGYSWVKLLASVDSDLSDVFRNWYSFLCNETVEYDMLVQSPWSLNHKKPPTPGLQSRDLVRDWLLEGRFSHNHFLFFMKRAMSFFDRKLICKNFKAQKVNPLVLHELYNSFPQCYLDQVLRRVENTRTIKKLALKLSLREPIVKKLMDMEHQFLGYLYWRSFKQGEIFSECATRHCRESRNKGWGMEIRGLTTPHPMEFLFSQTCDVYTQSCDGSDYVYAKIDPKAKFPPYLGSAVKTKVVSLQDIALRNEPLVVTSSKLLRFAKWLNLGENMLHLIRRNIRVVCNIDIFTASDDIEESFFAGSVEHRFNPSVASEGCYINYAPQIGQSVFMSSDNMPKYGRGQTNYTLHFQALYCFCQYEASHNSHTMFKHYHLTCEDCIVPVEDDVDDIQDMTELLDILYSEERVDAIRSALGYLDKKMITFAERINEEKHLLEILPVSELNVLRLTDGIHKLLSLKAAMMIMYARREIPDQMGSDDLQMFPRIYAYKLSSAKILDLVTEMLLVIKMARCRSSTTLTDFEIIKTKLLNQLLKVPLDKFKGIGSLCVGRTWSKENSEICPILNYGEFPEDPTVFLCAVRAEICDRLSSILQFPTRKKKVMIPVLGLTRKESLYLLFHHLCVTFHCFTCLSSVWRVIQSDISVSDCPESHVKASLNQVVGISLPLETGIKMLGLCSNQIAPVLIDKCHSFELENLWKLEGTHYIYMDRMSERLSQVQRELREKCIIRLPTASIYKWDYMLSHLQDRSYQNIIVLGDGIGYTSLVASKRFPDALIYPSALMERKRFIPQDMQSWRPFASRMYQNVCGELLEQVPDDIMDPRWTELFAIFLNRLEGTTLLITDVESSAGNKLIVDRVIHCSRLYSNHEVDEIHKVYLHEMAESIIPMNLYTNVFCNFQYYESFASTLDLTNETIPTQKLIDVNFWIDCTRNPEVSDLLQLKEELYSEARMISIKIAKSVFFRNFVPITDSVLSPPACVVVYAQLKYISGNFKAPYQGRLPDDNRLMLDGILVRVIKGLKMLLLMLYGLEVTRKDYFQFLHIVKIGREFRYYQVAELQAVLSIGRVEHKLTKKEETAAGILRLIWLKNRSGAEVPHPPSSLAHLYLEEVIKGKDWYKKLGHV